MLHYAAGKLHVRSGMSLSEPKTVRFDEFYRNSEVLLRSVSEPPRAVTVNASRVELSLRLNESSPPAVTPTLPLYVLTWSPPTRSNEILRYIWKARPCPRAPLRCLPLCKHGLRGLGNRKQSSALPNANNDIKQDVLLDGLHVLKSIETVHLITSLHAYIQE